MHGVPAPCLRHFRHIALILVRSPLDLPLISVAVSSNKSLVAPVALEWSSELSWELNNNIFGIFDFLSHNSAQDFLLKAARAG